jgi:hypothetical protein
MSSGLTKTCLINYTRAGILWAALKPRDYSTQCVINQYLRKQYTDISFPFNNQPDALIIQIYYVIKLYVFRASSLPIIRSFLLYIRH